MTNVGIYEFNPKDLIGHGAFAVVYKGRLKSVSSTFRPFFSLSLSMLSGGGVEGWLAGPGQFSNRRALGALAAG